MVATNDVGVDRLVRVITSTMAYARYYQEDWPKNCIALLEELNRQFKPLIKLFGRNLRDTQGVSVKGIELFTWNKKGLAVDHLIGITELGWLAIEIPSRTISLGCPPEIADLIGNNLEEAKRFVGECAVVARRLFDERYARLRELEAACLVDHMEQAFDRSKFIDTRRFMADLH